MDLFPSPSQCLRFCFNIKTGNNKLTLGNQLFMEFSQNEITVPDCANNREDQELAVLKHLRIAYTEIIVDLVTRKAVLNDDDKDKIFCSEKA